jgi:hypothetical protein
LIYRSDIIARKVVGQNNQVEPENLSVWYAVALRLTVIIAGFFFLWKTISILSMVSSYIQRFLQEGGSMWQFYGHIAYLLISLAISIYLLCGAPQFVRWQLKKTRELYKDSTTTP